MDTIDKNNEKIVKGDFVIYQYDYVKFEKRTCKIGIIRDIFEGDVELLDYNHGDFCYRDADKLVKITNEMKEHYPELFI